jgi:hypothetical protein
MSSAEMRRKFGPRKWAGGRQKKGDPKAMQAEETVISKWTDDVLAIQQIRVGTAAKPDRIFDRVTLATRPIPGAYVSEVELTGLYGGEEHRVEWSRAQLEQEFADWISEITNNHPELNEHEKQRRAYAVEVLRILYLSEFQARQFVPPERCSVRHDAWMLFDHLTRSYKRAHPRPHDYWTDEKINTAGADAMRSLSLDERPMTTIVFSPVEHGELSLRK